MQRSLPSQPRVNIARVRVMRQSSMGAHWRRRKSRGRSASVALAQRQIETIAAKRRDPVEAGVATSRWMVVNSNDIAASGRGRRPARGLEALSMNLAAEHQHPYPRR